MLSWFSPKKVSLTRYVAT